MRCANAAHYRLHPRIHALTIPQILKAIIARKNAQIRLGPQLRNRALERFRQTIHAVDMEIGYMQDSKTIEGRRQFRKFELNLGRAYRQGVLSAPLIETDSF